MSRFVPLDAGVYYAEVARFYGWAPADLLGLSVTQFAFYARSMARIKEQESP